MKKKQNGKKGAKIDDIQMKTHHPYPPTPIFLIFTTQRQR